MKEADIPQVLEIDRASFPSPWSRATYLSELRSPCSTFAVALQDQQGSTNTPASAITTITQHVSGEPCAPRGKPVIGYIGTWLSGEDLHVSTLAVAPSLRRQGAALRLLIHALENRRRQGARRATLEVRRSNSAALHLYHSIGFVGTGIRTGYYLDTGEDALVMWLHDLTAPETYVRIRRLKARQESRIQNGRENDAGIRD